MNATSEWELIRRCQQGFASAFEPLVRVYQGPSLGYATAMLGDADEAADALQDAFVAAYRGLPRLRSGSAFGPWFRTILRNICLDRLRSPRLSRRVHLEERTVDDVAWQEPRGSRALERAELALQLGVAMRELPDEQRIVLLMREVDGLSYGEIAGSLGIPPGTVASRLNHGRAALKRTLIARGIGLEDLT